VKRRILFIIAVLLLALGVLLWPHSGARPSHSPPAPVLAANHISAPAPSAAPSTPLVTDPDLAGGSPLAAELNSPDGDGLHDVRTLRALIRQYLRIMRNRRGPPIGDDIDLARILTGHNPMNLAFLPPGHPALSADGRLRDRWGTPYFIHPLGYGAFEVRSAGPDGKMFTQDDLVDGAGGHTVIPDE
jgi:hypothetical protein